MIIIITIEEIGLKFKENGYRKPKALINIYGKPIISHLLDSLNTDCIDYIYIPYIKEYKNHRFEDFLIENYPNIKFKFFNFEDYSIGTVGIINICINNLDQKKDIPVLCLNINNLYTCDLVSQWNGENSVFSFEESNKNNQDSFFITNNNDQILNINEKEKILNKACTGAYGFNSIYELNNYASKIIQKNKLTNSGYNIINIIKEMINDGKSFKNKTILYSNCICLETPLQLKFFYNNYPYKNCFDNEIVIKNKRFCFNLDNTLVTFPTIRNDYTSVKPIEKNIRFLKYLKCFGNTIIIYTSRGMKSHDGNIGKINSEIGKITFNTLEQFNIPYDEIYFGKPYADFYIDDLAYNSFEDLEKELGYYDNKIEPRDFHSINTGSVDTIIKNGDLEGENYYYQNIPLSLKDMFPIYLSGNNNTITLEKINGVTVTELYLSKILNEKILNNILNSIKRIQNCKIIFDDNINLYENYAIKLINRYQNFDYSLFEKSDDVYKYILQKLQYYEKNKLGKKKVIHGDPVFTNIIINNYGKIKFIDMRGRQGKKLTICGDWLYDWAKIYQSIIGYDEILLSKFIDTQYKENIINVFKKYFIDKFSELDFENLKIITKSLIFTLIPLHNNEKCIEYYKLLSSEYLK